MGVTKHGSLLLAGLGRIHLEFKYRMPYVCTILFEPKEPRVEVLEEEGFPYCEFAGYQTTAQAAIERLKLQGYNEAFFSTVLAPHLEDFEDFYLDTLIEDAPSEVSMKEASVHARFLENLDLSPFISAGSATFTAYIEFLRAILDGRRRRDLERKLAKIGASPNVLQNALRGTSLERTSKTRGYIELDLDDLWGPVFKLSWYLPTAVTRAASILCETCDDYGDFYGILVVWLLLKASAPKAPVVLNFGDLLEGPDYREEAATFLNRVKEEAATKALAFRHAFSLLLAKDAELDLMHRRYQVSALLAELNDESAQSCAADLKARGVDDPLQFAMSYAVINKNVFGSDVDVEGSPEKATLTMKRCSNLEAALQFAEKGMPLTKEQHCSGCINGYFKRVAENLGFSFDVAFTDKGCTMTMCK